MCDERRKALLAKIHVAKNQLLGEDNDDIYRGFVYDVSFGRTKTAKELTENEMRNLLRKFKRLGWRDSVSEQKKALRKIVISLSISYWGEDYKKRLDKLCKNKTGRPLLWLNVNQLRQIVAILRKMN